MVRLPGEVGGAEVGPVTMVTANAALATSSGTQGGRFSLIPCSGLLPTSSRVHQNGRKEPFT